MHKVQKIVLLTVALMFIILMSTIIIFASLYNDNVPLYAIIIMIVEGALFIGSVPAFLSLYKYVDYDIVRTFGDENNIYKEYNLIQPKQMKLYDLDNNVLVASFGQVKMNKKFLSIPHQFLWSNVSAVIINDEFIDVYLDKTEFCGDNIKKICYLFDNAVYHLLKTFYIGNIDNNNYVNKKEKKEFQYSYTLVNFLNSIFIFIGCLLLMVIWIFAFKAISFPLTVLSMPISVGLILPLIKKNFIEKIGGKLVITEKKMLHKTLSYKTIIYKKDIIKIEEIDKHIFIYANEIMKIDYNKKVLKKLKMIL